MWLLFVIGALSVLSTTCQVRSEQGPEPTKPADRRPFQPALDFEYPSEYAPSRASSPVQLPQHPAPEQLLELPAWLVHALPAAGPPSSGEAPTGVACERGWPVGQLQQLAAPSRPILRCMGEMATPPIEKDEFIAGCMTLRRIFYLIRDGASWRKASNPAELNGILGPARTQAEAVGRVALVFNDAWLPLTREARERALEYHRDWQAVAPIVAAEQGPNGFAVRLPLRDSCGCEHPIHVVSFSVGSDGSVTNDGRQGALLARAKSMVCFD